MSAPSPKPRNPEWVWLIAVAVFALVTVSATLFLRSYADNRREALTQLQNLETMAANQNSLEWRAIAEASDNVGQIPAIIGQMQSIQKQFWAQLELLATLENRSSFGNRLLGDHDSQAVIQDINTDAERYQGSAQDILGRLSGGMRNWAFESRQQGNFDFVNLWNTIENVGRRNRTLAERASALSNTITLQAVLVLLWIAFSMANRLSGMRARKTLELEQERSKAIQASEAKFKALVQHNAGLIAVLEPNHHVRYASPAIQSILGIDPDEAVSKQFWESVLKLTLEQRKLLKTLSQKSVEITARHAGGEPRELELHIQDHRDNPDLEGIVVNAHDITQRKQLERDLRFQAMHDPLTNLPNRRFFSQQLQTALADSIGKVGVLFVDLEGTKLVNDSFGHDRGDLILIEASRRVQSCLRSDDSVGRLGGDELVVMLASVQDEEAALFVANRILHALQLPFQIEGQQVFLTPSIGISLGGNESTPSDLVRHAGIAMYQAKREGIGKSLIFQTTMGNEAPERLRLESDLRKGLEEHQFLVVYQPKVNLRTGQVQSVEALVRWQHPERGFVSPAKFIPFAEETGLIEPLGKIVLETACRDAVAWQRPGKPLVVAVNLSAIQFRNPHLVEEVQEALERSGLPPQALELEITESAVLGDINSTIALMEQLKLLGIRLAIDDFGTGYSNLGHLRRFPVDVLKIDQSFVRGPDGFQKPIVEAVIGLAQALDLHTVAEGVETLEQMNQLKDLGCETGQGYYFAKPISREAIGEMLGSRAKTPQA